LDMASTRGIAVTSRLGSAGDVMHSNTPDWAFIYETSLVKDPKWNLGDHVEIPGGRTYIYCKSSAACISGQGVEVHASGFLAYTAFTVVAAVGATSITLPAATHDAVVVDELRGGYAVIWDGSTNNVQFRGIIGNDAAVADAACVIYLDGPLTEAITTSSCAEVYTNPYAAVRTGTMNYYPKIGIPAVKITAADTYFWVQKTGPCFAAPQGGKLGTTEGGYCGGLWSDYGNISDYNTSLGVTVANGRGSQHAGYALQGDADNIGPLFMLQG
jgi:hypothetical protein